MQYTGYVFLLINSMGAVCAMIAAAPVSPLAQVCLQWDDDDDVFVFVVFVVDGDEDDI